jgi:hypothetical protein
MERIVFLPQPFAAMAVSNLLPVVPLEVRTDENRNRFLVYATKSVENQEVPIEWVMEAYNHMVYGNIPETDRVPINAIVGYVEVCCHPCPDRSIWTARYRIPMYRVVKSRVFAYPLHVLRSALESNFIGQILGTIPVYDVHAPCMPETKCDELVLPVNTKLFRRASLGGELTLDLSDELACQVLDKNGVLRRFLLLTLTCGIHRLRFKFQGEIAVVLNGNAEPVLYPSVLQSCGRDIRKQLILSLVSTLM